MKKLFILSVILGIFAVGLGAAEYKYFYKNGKKYRVKVAPSDAQYKYFYKNGKKYRVKIAPKTKPQQDENYKYFYKNGKKYRAKVSPKKDENISAEVLEKPKKSPFSVGVNLVSRSYVKDYSFETKEKNCTFNQYCTLENPEVGEFLADGKTHSFSQNKNAIGIMVKLNYELENKHKIHTYFYKDAEQIDIGLGGKYIFVRDFFGLDPFAQGDLTLVYESSNALAKISPQSLSFLVALGVEYDLDDFFVELGLGLSSVNFSPKESLYTKEKTKLTDKKLFLGVNYRF